MKKIVDYKEFSVANRFSMYMGSAQKIDNSNDVFVIGWGSGLMSISWTRKVKLFYDTLLANNSH